jgi:hypothetical protein
MELRHMNNTTTKKMNKLLESRYGALVGSASMTPAKAKRMLAIINESIAAVKNSSAAHSATQEPAYMEMIMVRESVNQYMRDYTPSNAPGAKKAPVLKPVKAAATGRSAVAEMSRGNNYKMITRAVELASRGRPVPSQYMEAFIPLIQQLTKRKLTEGELGKSEVILAANDMVDTVQDIIEDLSRMAYEQLPQLLDSIRDQIGSEQADAFGASVTPTLSTLLDSVRTSRETINGAARSLSGEQAPRDMNLPTAQTDIDMNDPEDDVEDPFGAADAAQGGANAMGREQR